MSKIAYDDHNLRGSSLRMIELAEGILDDMKAQGYTLTLRQLYYQFVAKNLIENTERSYKNISKLMTKARENGLISWTAIEDRGRECRTYHSNEDFDGIFNNMEYRIRYDMWERQENYVEVWVEKDALVGVVGKPCEEWNVPFMACKGYLSASEAWRAGMRFAEAAANGKNCYLIHLGDHDPSGIDMTRDNGLRLEKFSGVEVEVKRIGLNRDQIDKYNPPKNPAKFKDPRAHDYIKKHGKNSWELDALTPKVITDLILKNIKPLIDMDVWQETLDEEEAIRERLRALPELHDKIFKLVDKHLEQ